jgi:putative endonuclease
VNVSVKPLLRLKKRQLTSKQKQQPNTLLGHHGEQLAISYLQEHGFRVVDTNVRVGNEEVDIVAFDTGVQEIVFVEVKTRSTQWYGSPSSAVDWKKMRSLRFVAKTYCRMKNLTQDYRFDIITVLPGKIDHYHNISWGMVK